MNSVHLVTQEKIPSRKIRSKTKPGARAPSWPSLYAQAVRPCSPAGRAPLSPCAQPRAPRAPRTPAYVPRAHLLAHAYAPAPARPSACAPQRRCCSPAARAPRAPACAPARAARQRPAPARPAPCTPRTCAQRLPSLRPAPCRCYSGRIAIQTCCPLNCIAIQFPHSLTTSVTIQSIVLRYNPCQPTLLSCNTITVLQYNSKPILPILQYNPTAFSPVSCNTISTLQHNFSFYNIIGQ